MSRRNKQGARSTFILPSWATVWKENDRVKETSRRKDTQNGHDYGSKQIPVPSLTVEQEEAYLRTRAYQYMETVIDNVVQEAVKDTISDIVINLQEFFSMQEVPSRKRNKRGNGNGTEIGIDSTEFDEENDFFGISHSSHEHDASQLHLPVAILNGPASILDRHELFQYMVDSYRTQEKNLDVSPAICWLANLGEAVSNRYDWAPLLYEILQQCIHQESNPLAYSKLTKRHDALLKWARKTTEFDSIILFLEHIEGMPTLQGFLHHLAELRTVHGLPIHVILLAPSGNLQLRSSTQSQNGLSLAHFSLPTSDEWMTQVWTKVSKELWVSPSTMRFIRASFSNHHQSLVRSVMMLKVAVAHSMLKPGSFVAASHSCSEFAKQESYRLDWFEVDPHAKMVCGNYVSRPELRNEANEIQNKRKEVMMLCRVLLILLQLQTSFDAIADMDESCWGLFRDHGKWISSALNECKSSTKLLQRLVLAMESMHQNPTGLTTQQTFRRRLEATILLLYEDMEECDNVSKAAIRDVEFIIHDMFQRVALLRKEVQHGFRLDFDASTNDTLSPQVRSAIATQLMNPDHMPAGALLESAAQLFDLMKDAMAISRYVLFDLFKKSYGETKSHQETWQVFALGVYHLILVGLIREKRTNGRFEIVYEKAAVVWCSGVL